MIRTLLAPLSLLYGMVIHIRNKFYDWGVFAAQEYDIPIVCVGNLAVGGTGKTPMAELLIDHFSHGYNVALLSRGYKRRTKGFVEAQVDSSFLAVGDEPKQIKMKYPEAVVAVCEDRNEGIRRIRAIHPEVNLIVLDDGFQFRSVEAWVNIVMMDYSKPFYNDHLLPWGDLRDSTSQLHRAHFVVVTKCPPDINALNMRIVNKSLGLYPYQRLYFSFISNGSIAPLFADVATDKILAGHNVIVMAGVANPAPMVASVEERYTVVDKLIFPDHHPYRMRDLALMERKLREAPEGTIIVTTEKDAVKLTNRKRIPLLLQQRLYLMPIKMSFIEYSEQNFLRKLDHNVKSNPKYGLLH